VSDASTTAPVRRVEKPWGHEIIWAHTERYVGKLLHIKEGCALSLQYHRVKDETVHVFTGQLRFQVGRQGALEDRLLGPGESFHITPGLWHRMVAVTDCDILEASTPELDDVVRIEDRYGRVGTSTP
jgi:quercetin dioxygenase-like cupin family protein